LDGRWHPGWRGAGLHCKLYREPCGGQVFVQLRDLPLGFEHESGRRLLELDMPRLLHGQAFLVAGMHPGPEHRHHQSIDHQMRPETHQVHVVAPFGLQRQHL